MAIRDQKEFVAGMLFAAIGAAALIQSFAYELGTITQMGPGYYPACIGMALIVAGTCSIIRAMWRAQPDRLQGLAWRDMIFVLTGVLLFAVLIDRLGLIEAVAALIVMSCFGRIARRPIEVLVIGVALAALSVGVFVYGLNIPISIY